MSESTNDPVAPMKLEDAEVAFYQDQGYLPLPGFLAADAVAGLRAEILAVLKETQGLDYDALRQATTVADKLRQCGAYLSGSQIDRMINSPHTLALASRLIGGQAVRYLPFTAVKSGGGGGEFHLHQDNNYTRHEPAMGSINIWVALVDMTPENGCLMLAPASHQQGQAAATASLDGDHRMVAERPPLVIPIRMRAGDAVAFSRWTIHGSGPNHSTEPRVAYALQYHREDVRYLDQSDESWKSLREHPRWSTEPLASLSDWG